jgi:ElaB/YqjD/DUF883 family membrane-anchored ribosome-binding protein
MPPRKTELPEGTDHIVNGAMETNAGSRTGSGSAGLTGGGGGTSSGFIGGTDTSVLGDDTGGTVAGGTGGTGRGRGTGGGGGSGGGDFGSGGGSRRERAIGELKGGAQNLRDQATTKVRAYAEDGKGRATTALDDFSGVLRDTASQIDDRIGAEYGQYARRAADAVQDFADNIRNKEVDELYDDARNLVRKSPAVAIGVAAAVGFALVRLVKAGMPAEDVDVEFRPDPDLGSTSSATGTPPSVTPRSGA